MRNLSAAALTMLLAGCASPTTTERPMSETLPGSDWRLVSIEGVPVLATPDVTLKFEAERIVGSAGVNGYFGGYTLDGTSLRVSQVGATRMMGPPEAQAQEDRFLTALQSVDGCAASDVRLELRRAGAAVLVFERARDR